MDIDTIRLKFAYAKPNNVFFQEKIRGKQSWTNNAWRKQEKKKGLYVPKYWVEEDFINPDKTYFYFEASLPKLLKGENITALDDDRFDEVLTEIVDFCKKIGVYIFPDIIRKSVPTLVAIGENINLTSFCYVNDALKVLKPFDYKPHFSQRLVDFSDQKNGGKEVIFSITNETLKAYNKGREIRNNGESAMELEIADLLNSGQYLLNGESASEILRIELTLKTKRKIQQKFKPYLKEKTPTFENIFKQNLWYEILKNDINRTFNHPLQKLVFLALESQPYIDNFLDQNYSHIYTKDTVRGILLSLQSSGLAETRKIYLEKYKSRQTWYNYLKRLKELEKHFNWSALSKLENVKVHSRILGHFGISNKIQQSLGSIFDTQMSKNIDIEPRNAKRHDFD